jgi:hypothetical protein
MAGGTDGNIISFDASGDPVAIATGSDGQVLTSTGAGSPPAFESVASVTWQISAIVWNLTSAAAGSLDPFGTTDAHWEIADDVVPEDRMGSATLISPTSGIWSFDATGYYRIYARLYLYTGGSPYNYAEIHTTDDNSTFQIVARASTGLYTGGTEASVHVECLLKITNVTNHKFKIKTVYQGGSGVQAFGSATIGLTSVMAIKLGDI